MNLKKKSLILSVVFVIIIQLILYINNSQKSSFKYFIWNIQEITIGRLISISFFSGLFISTILNKTIISNIKTYSPNEGEDYQKEKYSDFINKEDNNTSFDIPPQRDLREPQPTISVNYRVIKNSNENDFVEENFDSNNQKYQDDWENNDADW